MPEYISAIIDKSTLQSLSAREAKWLFHHFRVTIPPVLFAEVIGDLEKKKIKALATGTPDGDVRMLAAKITSHSVFLSAAHQDLIDAEIAGQPIEMAGRPHVSNAKVATMQDGSRGLYVDQTPFQAVMDRWRSGDFDGMEREFAKLWREGQASIDLERLLRETKYLRDQEAASLDAVVKRVHAAIFGPGRDFRNLTTIMQIAGVAPPRQAWAVERWKKSGRPRPWQFMPYTSFVARLEAIFMFGLHSRIITTRATNRIDLQYLKYLPFTEVFSSGDRLHQDLYPVCARRDQSFVLGRELKKALCEMADYYDQLSDDQKSQGSMSYADYPPVHMNNAVTALFDDRFPNWRGGANLPKPPRDKSRDAELLAEIKSRFEWLKHHAK